MTAVTHAKLAAPWCPWERYTLQKAGLQLTANWLLHGAQGNGTPSKKLQLTAVLWIQRQIFSMPSRQTIQLLAPVTAATAVPAATAVTAAAAATTTIAATAAVLVI